MRSLPQSLSFHFCSRYYTFRVFRWWQRRNQNFEWNYQRNVYRCERSKVNDYIKKTVTCYDDIDFMIHFHLYQTFTDELISRLRCIRICIILLLNILSLLKLMFQLFLWFVSHKSSYRDVADWFRMTISNLFAVISRVTNFF